MTPRPDHSRPASTGQGTGTAVRKVVIPAAGLGRRMLPITKSIPKEMMPIANRPVIQYAVEEAAASGLRQVILVTRADKSLLQSYFDCDPKLEDFLIQRGYESELGEVRRLSSLVDISVVEQESPRGLGDAILCARAAVGDEPFAVILPDAVIYAREPVLGQLLSAFRRQTGSYVATQPLDPCDLSRFGVLAVTLMTTGLAQQLFRVLSLVEKPAPREAPSRYGVFGRYLLLPRIFDFLQSLKPDRQGEVQLTEALSLYAQQEALYALRFEGKHFDVGDRLGYLQANLEMALLDAEVGTPLREYLATLAGDDAVVRSVL